MRQAIEKAPQRVPEEDREFERVMDRLGECVEYAETLLAVGRRLTRSRRGATMLFLALVQARLNTDNGRQPETSRFKKPILLSLLRRLYIEGAHLPAVK